MTSPNNNWLRIHYEYGHEAGYHEHCPYCQEMDAHR